MTKRPFHHNSKSFFNKKKKTGEDVDETLSCQGNCWVFISFISFDSTVIKLKEGYLRAYLDIQLWSTFLTHIINFIVF